MPNQPQAFPSAKFEADILDGEEFAVPKRSFACRRGNEWRVAGNESGSAFGAVTSNWWRVAGIFACGGCIFTSNP
jgi:hypothetical protein